MSVHYIAGPLLERRRLLIGERTYLYINLSALSNRSGYKNLKIGNPYTCSLCYVTCASCPVIRGRRLAPLFACVLGVTLSAHTVHSINNNSNLYVWWAAILSVVKTEIREAVANCCSLFNFLYKEEDVCYIFIKIFMFCCML